MILTVGNIKGGIGKSALATNIAVFLSMISPAGSVLCIDGDKQGTAANFTAGRAGRLGDAGYTCVRAVGAEVLSQVQTMKDKFQHIVIDAGGQDNPSLRASLVVSEKVLVPAAPRSFETWVMEDMCNLVTEAQAMNPDLEATCVINLGFPSGSDNQQTQDMIARDYQTLRLLETVVVQRKVWSDLGGMGLSIADKPQKDDKATIEFASLLVKLGVNKNDVQRILG